MKMFFRFMCCFTAATVLFTAYIGGTMAYWDYRNAKAYEEYQEVHQRLLAERDYWLEHGRPDLAECCQ